MERRWMLYESCECLCLYSFFKLNFSYLYFSEFSCFLETFFFHLLYFVFMCIVQISDNWIKNQEVQIQNYKRVIFSDLFCRFLFLLNIQYWQFSASLSENDRTLNYYVISLGLKQRRVLVVEIKSHRIIMHPTSCLYFTSTVLTLSQGGHYLF